MALPIAIAQTGGHKYNRRARRCSRAAARSGKNPHPQKTRMGHPEKLFVATGKQGDELNFDRRDGRDNNVNHTTFAACPE